MQLCIESEGSGNEALKLNAHDGGMILKSKTVFDITQDDVSIINITNKDLIKLRQNNNITPAAGSRY